MGPQSHETTRLRERLSQYLKAQYSGAHATKALSRDMGSTSKAAENVLNGHWPSDIHLAAIVRRFGRSVLAAVFEPEIEPVLARLREREAALDKELQAARARRLEAEGSSFGHPDRVEKSEAQNEPIE